MKSVKLQLNIKMLRLVVIAFKRINGGGGRPCGIALTD